MTPPPPDSFLRLCSAVVLCGAGGGARAPRPGAALPPPRPRPSCFPGPVGPSASPPPPGGGGGALVCGMAQSPGGSVGPREVRRTRCWIQSAPHGPWAHLSPGPAARPACVFHRLCHHLRGGGFPCPTDLIRPQHPFVMGPMAPQVRALVRRLRRAGVGGWIGGGGGGGRVKAQAPPATRHPPSAPCPNTSHTPSTQAFGDAPVTWRPHMPQTPPPPPPSRPPRRHMCSAVPPPPPRVPSAPVLLSAAARPMFCVVWSGARPPIGVSPAAAGANGVALCLE